MIKDRVLISFSTYNQPWFLEHCLETLERYDPGYTFDLLIYDNTNTDPKSLKLLEKYSKKYRVETKPNIGRAQHGYDMAWKNNKDYKYYLFLHDDSSFLRDNWLKVGIDRINDYKRETVIKGINHFLGKVGKVGYQGYEWGTKYKYLRTGYNQVFHYMDPIAEILDIKIPHYYQHINDDKILLSNEYLTKLYNSSNKIWNVEDWKEMELNGGDERWKKINQWFIDNNLENFSNFNPHRYTYIYHKFQTVSEFLNDIAPMQNGFRTHCVVGDGYCQEELGFNSFWGNEFITHWGDHVVFKGLSRIFKSSEEEIRKRFKDKAFLITCSNIIKNESKNFNRRI